MTHHKIEFYKRTKIKFLVIFFFIFTENVNLKRIIKKIKVKTHQKNSGIFVFICNIYLVFGLVSQKMVASIVEATNLVIHKTEEKQQIVILSIVIIA